MGNKKFNGFAAKAGAVTAAFGLMTVGSTADSTKEFWGALRLASPVKPAFALSRSAGCPYSNNNHSYAQIVTNASQYGIQTTLKEPKNFHVVSNKGQFINEEMWEKTTGGHWIEAGFTQGYMSAIPGVSPFFYTGAYWANNDLTGYYSHIFSKLSQNGLYLYRFNIVPENASGTWYVQVRGFSGSKTKSSYTGTAYSNPHVSQGSGGNFGIENTCAANKLEGGYSFSGTGNWNLQSMMKKIHTSSGKYQWEHYPSTSVNRSLITRNRSLFDLKIEWAGASYIGKKFYTKASY